MRRIVGASLLVWGWLGILTQPSPEELRLVLFLIALSCTLGTLLLCLPRRSPFYDE